MSHYAPVNESIRLETTIAPALEMQSALAAFCRRNGFAHLYFEVLGPMLAKSELVLALASTERPWPPKGIGSIAVDAVGIAMIGSEGRALLTPVLTDRKHATNLGLMAAVTKRLLEGVQERKATAVGYLVRQGEPALERALEQAGFAKSDLIAATEHAEYVTYSGEPAAVLKSLGLAGARHGEVMSLAFEGKELDRLGAYHFALSAALAPYLWDSIALAALLPGLIDIVATLPPGGVPPGTPGPTIGPIGPGER